MRGALRMRQSSLRAVRAPRTMRNSGWFLSSAILLALRPATSSFFGHLSDLMSAKLSRLTQEVWLDEEKLVTETRRRLQPQRSSDTSLTQRLTSQRMVRQRLVPTSVRVDRSRQYVEFTWPVDAVEAMRQVTGEAKTAAPLPGAPHAVPSSPLAAEATDIGAAPSGSTPTTPPLHTSCATTAPIVPESSPLRTRALAEYLRAYTPSTDGAFSGKDIVIYGRRGLTIAQIIPVGNYALRFVFSDDHNGGIYSYEYLYYLTGPSTKYGLMRGYIAELRARHKTRDPPKRAPSKKRKYANAIRPTRSEEDTSKR